MKVLFAPYNIASMPAVTASALKAMGHSAVCINYGSHPYQESNDQVIDICSNSGHSNPFRMIYYKLKYLIILYRLLKWCDVVHFTWRSIVPFSLDLRMIAWFGKPRFIEWVGSDIRIPEITSQESKWYAEAYQNGYEYKKIESRHKSLVTQKRFAQFGFVPILTPEMQLFLSPDLFKKYHAAFYRVFDENKFGPPFYPELDKPKLLILHAPSAKMAKGSNYIIPIVNELSKTYPIAFELLNQVPRQQVLEKMKMCDIYIDQIVLGSYASAAIEAMSYGKPVIAYIMPRVYRQGIPEDCPVVNANPENLKERLVELIENPKLRRDIGVKSRTYVEAHHEVHKLTRELVEIYRSFPT
ncbi:MAG TPA: glycosyltransferase [Saprospiraceae bacterium]|nr:glycosyltransferase [Saprospiraceae bacterium]